jgi:hypothetical protein
LRFQGAAKGQTFVALSIQADAVFETSLFGVFFVFFSQSSAQASSLGFEIIQVCGLIPNIVSFFLGHARAESDEADYPGVLEVNSFSGSRL